MIEEELWTVMECAISNFRFYAIDYLYANLNVLPILKHIYASQELKLKWDRYLEWEFYMPLLLAQSERKLDVNLGVLREIQKFL